MWTGVKYLLASAKRSGGRTQHILSQLRTEELLIYLKKKNSHIITRFGVYSKAFPPIN